MKLGLYAGIAAGCVLALALLAWFGLPEIGHALGVAGWTGLFAVTLMHLPSLVLCGLAWRQVTPAAPPRSHGLFVLARWVRDSAGTLVAVLPVSSELMGVRILTFMGLARSAAAASVVADVTAELLSQFLYTLGGVALLSLHDAASPLMRWSGIGLLLSIPILAGLVLVQRFGILHLIELLSTRLADSLHLQVRRAAHSLHGALDAIYSRAGRIVSAVLLHLAAWIVAAAETWIGALLLGHPLTVWQVLVMESLVYALRTSAFFIPSGLGVQEGGYVAVGALFGFDPPSALALSILKRGRELLLAIPGLVFWQAVEGRRILARRSGPDRRR